MVKGRCVILEMPVDIRGQKRGRQGVPNVGVLPGVHNQETH